MSRRLLRSRMFWVLLILGVLVFTAWWKLRPISTLTLPDGTKIHLMKITVGTEHRYKFPIQSDSSPWSHLMQMFSPELTVTTDQEEPVFHFKISHPGGGAWYSPRVDTIYSHLSDGTPVEHIVAPSWSMHPVNGPRDMSQSESGLKRASLTLSGPTLLIAPHYDRRQRVIPIQIFWLGKEYPWTLPNPLFGHEFPNWQPEPFPIIRTDGNLTLRINGWKRDQDSRGSLDVTMLVGEDVIEPTQYKLECEFSDPTGQTSTRAYLSTAEAAWRVRLKISPGDSVLDERKGSGATSSSAGNSWPKHFETEFFISPPPKSAK